jgi:hypothetical protein
MITNTVLGPDLFRILTVCRLLPSRVLHTLSCVLYTKYLQTSFFKIFHLEKRHAEGS